MNKKLILIDKIFSYIIILLFITMFFTMKYLPDRLLFAIPLLICLLIIPNVFVVADRNEISQVRRKILVIFNSIVDSIYIIFLLLYDYLDDPKQYFLVMLMVLLIQGGISGILTKHLFISRNDSSILDGKWIVNVFNGLFIMIGSVALIYFVINW